MVDIRTVTIHKTEKVLVASMDSSDKREISEGRIMVKFDFYAIYVETSERSGEVVDIFSSFEECMEHRMEHANWFCPKGDIWILHINNGKNFRPSEKWYVNADGSIKSY